MIIKANPETYFVFDLDDTLYNEIDYLKSAYKYIAFEINPQNKDKLYNKMFRIYKAGGDTFHYLIESYPEKKITKENLLYLYRNHYPEISLREGVLRLFKEIKERGGMIGIITDGRSITQRNKLKALGISGLIDSIVISGEFGNEKPDPSLFKSFMKTDSVKQLYYIGDNVSKDFITPKKLSWCCIGVFNKKNIRSEEFSNFSMDFFPHFFINKFSEIEII
jgi:putative hydrolase of the HAD superfamily